MKKEMTQVLVELQRQNWRLKRTRKGYMAFRRLYHRRRKQGAEFCIRNVRNL